MKHASHLFVAAASLLVVFVSFSHAFAGTWAGKEVTKEGVVHVMNPVTPSDGQTTITPREVWRAGGDEEEDVLFGVLTSVDIDDQGNVYALDMQLSQVNVFDRDGNLLRTIGREGEGPGEFRRASAMFLMPDANVAVLQQMPGKLVLLSPDGKPAGDFQGPQGTDGGTLAYFEGGRAGNAVVLNTRQFSQKDTKLSIQRALYLVDRNGKTRAILFETNSEQEMAGSTMNMDEKDMRRLVWAAGKDGRIYTSENFDAYAIRVYSPEGKLERVIEREYSHRQRSKEEMEENKPRVMMRGGRGGQRMQPEIKSSATDRDVLRMLPREDGSLWVLSSKGAFGQPKGTMAAFDVFDAQGHFVRTVAFQVPGDFKQDEFYVVRDQIMVVRSIRSARDALMGGDQDATKQEAEVDPVTLVAFRFDAPATAKR
jgi:6-bladed beta-propeller